MHSRQGRDLRNTTNVIKIFRYLLHSGRLFYRMARHVTKESSRSSSMIKIILSFRDSLRATCLRHVSSLFFSVSTNRLKSNALRDIRQTSLTSVRLIALIKCARYIRPCESRNWDLALFYLEHVWFLSFILELIPELNLTFRNFVSLKRIHSCVVLSCCKYNNFLLNQLKRQVKSYIHTTKWVHIWFQ